MTVAIHLAGGTDSVGFPVAGTLPAYEMELFGTSMVFAVTGAEEAERAILSV